MHKEEWSNLHGGAEVKGVIKIWLDIAEKFSKLILRFKISPNFLTLLSLLASIPLISHPNYWWLALLSLLLDGLDGSLAILSNRVSKFGALLDSVVDRCVEFLWAIALFKFGANILFLSTFIGSAWLCEYIRARSGGIGFQKIGVVTVSERPVRSIFIIILLAASFIGIEKFFTIILIFATALQVIALYQIVKSIKKLIN